MLCETQAQIWATEEVKVQTYPYDQDYNHRIKKLLLKKPAQFVSLRMKEEDKRETKLFGVRGPEHGRENIRKTSEMWRTFGGNTNQGAVSKDHQPGDYEDQHKLKHKETQSSTTWICWSHEYRESRCSDCQFLYSGNEQAHAIFSLTPFPVNLIITVGSDIK